MTTQIKTTLLTGLFFFGLLTGLQAQDKYDYAVITFYPLHKDLGISINGTDYKIVEISKTDYGINPPLKEISKMTADGWELFNTDMAGVSVSNDPLYVFYLRKKVG